MNNKVLGNPNRSMAEICKESLTDPGVQDSPSADPKLENFQSNPNMDRPVEKFSPASRALNGFQYDTGLYGNDKNSYKQQRSGEIILTSELSPQAQDYAKSFKLGL